MKVGWTKYIYRRLIQIISSVGVQFIGNLLDVIFQCVEYSVFVLGKLDMVS